MLTPVRCRSIPVLPQLHIKDPGQSTKSAGGRLHLNTNTPLQIAHMTLATWAAMFHLQVLTWCELYFYASKQWSGSHCLGFSMCPQRSMHGHHEMVGTETQLWEKSPLLHQEIKPLSLACRTRCFTNWATSLPQSLHREMSVGEKSLAARGSQTQCSTNWATSLPKDGVKHHKWVCTERWLWEKNPLLHQEVNLCH